MLILLGNLVKQQLPFYSLPEFLPHSTTSFIHVNPFFISTNPFPLDFEISHLYVLDIDLPPEPLFLSDHMTPL